MSAIAAASAQDTEPLFVSSSEAREILGLADWQLRQLRASGAGPKFVRMTKNTIYYWRVEVLAYRATLVL